MGRKEKKTGANAGSGRLTARGINTAGSQNYHGNVDQSRKGLTPLMRASGKGHSAIVQKLLDKGADAHVSLTSGNFEGYTALLFACLGGHEGCVEVLLSVEGIQVNNASKQEWTPLTLACWQGNIGIVKQLLARGANAHAARTSGENEGYTALHTASERGHEGCVAVLLLVEGIEVDGVDREGTTPLMLACNDGHTGTVKQLLGRGANVRAAPSSGDFEGRTALHEACEGGHEDCVAVLLSVQGIEVDRADKRGATPLLLALKNKHIVVVGLLLSRLKLDEAATQTGNDCMSGLLKPETILSDALRYSMMLVKIAPKCGDEWHNYACYLHANGQIEQSQKAFQQALSLGGSQSTYCGYAHFLLANREKITEGNKPLAMLKSIVESKPDGSGLMYTLLEKNTIKHTILYDELSHYGQITLTPHTLATWLLVTEYLNQGVTKEDTLAWSDALKRRLLEKPPEHEIEWVLCGYAHSRFDFAGGARECFARAGNPSQQTGGYLKALQNNDLPEMKGNREEGQAVSNSTSSHYKTSHKQSVARKRPCESKQDQSLEYSLITKKRKKIIPWGTVVSIASKIYEQAEAVSMNKAQSALLAKRVKIFLSFVGIKNKIGRNPPEGTGPKFEYSDALHQTLKDALDLLVKLQSKSTFRHCVGGAQGWRTDLEEVNQRLDRDAKNFGVAAEMQGLVGQEADHKTLMSDLMDLKSAIRALRQSSENPEENTKSIIASLEFTKTSLDELLRSQQELFEDHVEIQPQLQEVVKLLTEMKTKTKASSIVVTGVKSGSESVMEVRSGTTAALFTSNTMSKHPDEIGKLNVTGRRP